MTNYGVTFMCSVARYWVNYSLKTSDKDGNMGRLRDVSPSQGLLQSAILLKQMFQIKSDDSDVLKQVFSSCELTQK